MSRSKKDLPLTFQPILCTHCGNQDPMLMICEGKYTQVFGEEHEIDQGFFEDLERRWQVVVCSSCEEVLLLQESGWSTEEYIVDSDEKGREIWKRPFKQETLYPPQKKAFVHLPPSVSRAYGIAVKLLPIEPIAFAVFAGRTLEFVCKDKNAQGKTLKQQLDDLAKRGEIPNVLSEMAHSIRFFRNQGAHATEIEEISRGDAEDIRHLCEAILEYIYEFRPMLERVQYRLNELRQSSTNQDTA